MGYVAAPGGPEKSIYFEDPWHPVTNKKDFVTLKTKSKNLFLKSILKCFGKSF
jgi:hypothetical protein